VYESFEMSVILYKKLSSTLHGNGISSFRTEEKCYCLLKVYSA